MPGGWGGGGDIIGKHISSSSRGGQLHSARWFFFSPPTKCVECLLLGLHLRLGAKIRCKKCERPSRVLRGASGKREGLCRHCPKCTSKGIKHVRLLRLLLRGLRGRGSKVKVQQIHVATAAATQEVGAV